MNSLPQRLMHRLVQSADVHDGIHGAGLVGRFNSWLAIRITHSVGSMWCAYVFVLLTLVSFPQALAAFLDGDRVTGVSWVAQTFLQLVLLPIILVGQRVISDSQDARAAADHETLTILHTINIQQTAILELLASRPASQPIGDVHASS